MSKFKKRKLDNKFVQKNLKNHQFERNEQFFMGSNFSFQFDVDIFGIKGSPRRKSRRACLA